MKVYGQLEYAQLEQSTPGTVSGSQGGRIYADITSTSAIIPRFHDGTAYREVALLGLAKIVNADIAAAAAIDPSKLAARQVAIGTAQTSSGSVTNTSFADITNQPTLTFTAAYSGKYKILASMPVGCGSTAQVSVFRINNSVGSATVNFSQEGALTLSSIIQIVPMDIFMIATLTAGVSYTFKIQAKSSGGSTASLLSGTASNGVALIALQME